MEKCPRDGVECIEGIERKRMSEFYALQTSHGLSGRPARHIHHLELNSIIQNNNSRI